MSNFSEEKIIIKDVKKVAFDETVGQEYWKQYKDTCYFISNYGRFLNRITGNLRKPPPEHSKRYFTLVVLSESLILHRLVVEAFIGKIPVGYVINHKDSNRLNNKVSNLEICTSKENSKHAQENKLIQHNKGEKAWNCKLSDDQILEMQQIRATGLYTLTYISQLFNCSLSHTSQICNGTSRSEKFNPNLCKKHKISYPGSRSFCLEDQISIVKLIIKEVSFKEIVEIFPTLKFGIFRGIKRKKSWFNIFELIEKNLDRNIVGF